IPDIWYVSPTDAVNNLIGTGITVSNISFTGDSKQLARFNDGLDKIGFETGVAITTGKAAFAGTNQTSDVGNQQPVGITNSDPDLNMINGTGPVYNSAYLEFDFETTGTQLQFTLVFASDEYLDYVNLPYSDAMGIFLSGNNNSGPFSNGAINIATIPNGDPISINTINNLQNTNYFIANPWVGQLGVPTTEATAGFAYDGWTTPIEVTYTIECDPNEQYHIRFAICNTTDKNFDSGI